MRILIEIGGNNSLKKRLDLLIKKVTLGGVLTKEEMKEAEVLSKAESYLNA